MLRTLAALGLALLVGTASANGALITTSPVSAEVVDFSQFAAVTLNSPQQVGSLVSEDILWSSSSTGALVGNIGYFLGDNGTWNSGRLGFTGLNFTSGSGFYTQFQFNSGPVSSVGGLVNYAVCSVPDCHPAQHFIIEALGVGNVSLEIYDVSFLAPISTPGGVNAGAFRGISRATDDIVAFRLYNSVHVLDDLTFDRVGGEPIPEPTTVALLALGLAGVFRNRRVSA